MYKRERASLREQSTTSLNPSQGAKPPLHCDGVEENRAPPQLRCSTQQFAGGTECDLTGVLRSSTVFLKCGAVDAVKEVVEDATCHYRVVAESPLLCRFVPYLEAAFPG